MTNDADPIAYTEMIDTGRHGLPGYRHTVTRWAVKDKAGRTWTIYKMGRGQWHWHPPEDLLWERGELLSKIPQHFRYMRDAAKYLSKIN